MLSVLLFLPLCLYFWAIDFAVLRYDMVISGCHWVETAENCDGSMASTKRKFLSYSDFRLLKLRNKHTTVKMMRSMAV